MSTTLEIIEPKAVQENAMQRFEDMGKFLAELKLFLSDHMTAGVDYGSIPMGGNRDTKPTLFKPGAEKLLNFFNYSAKFETTEKVEDHDNGYFYFKYKCEIFNKAGEFIGDGFGSANTREKKWTGQKAFDVVNTVDKMAQKRALLQATLLATRASEFYTQDLEDMPTQESSPKPPTAAQKVAERYPEQEPEEVTFTAFEVSPGISKNNKEFVKIRTMNDEFFYDFGSSKGEYAPMLSYKCIVENRGSGEKPFMVISQFIAVVDEKTGEDAPF